MPGSENPKVVTRGCVGSSFSSNSPCHDQRKSNKLMTSHPYMTAGVPHLIGTDAIPNESMVAMDAFPKLMKSVSEALGGTPMDAASLHAREFGASHGAELRQHIPSRRRNRQLRSTGEGVRLLRRHCHEKVNLQYPHGKTHFMHELS